MRLLLGFLVFLAWASIARYGYVCEIKQHCQEEEPVENLRPQTLQLLLDDTITVLENYEQFAFDQNSATPDLSENNLVFLDSLADYLRKDTLKNLTITGFYRETEEGMSSGMFEGFGIARAAAVRDLLVARGIDINRISLESQKSIGSKLLEPLIFSLSTAGDATPDDYNTVQFSFTNMTYSDANFEKDSDVFLPKQAFQFYADSVKTFLDLNPEKTLRIVGHCDSDGTEKYNYELGLNRAKNASIYFKDLGVEKDIVVESQGEKDPIKPNDSPENKQANRRVQIIIE